MLIKSHKDLRVWQRAMDLAMELYWLTQRFPIEERYGLSEQMRRASRSIPANISEAWRRRRYPGAFIAKLNDAESEAAETQTHIEIARRCTYINDEQAAVLDTTAEQLIRTLATMANRPESWCLPKS